jgi:hypothetical protein
MNGHVALLGDSVFDNGAYTSRAPDVFCRTKGAHREPQRPARRPRLVAMEPILSRSCVTRDSTKGWVGHRALQCPIWGVEPGMGLVHKSATPDFDEERE